MAQAVAQPEVSPVTVLPTLARKEVGRYARHPAFLLGALLTALASIGPPDDRMSSLGAVIVPAAGIGLFGLVVMASLARSGDRIAGAAGTVATDQRTRTLALAAALVVPLTVGLVWFGWAVWAYRTWPPPTGGLPFGGVGDAWVYSVLFALGVVSCVGGPVLGLVIARWLPMRGAAPVAVVLLVLVTILMQGLFAATRPFRLVMPWTYFGGPIGIAGDRNRMLILTGSPQWYVGYLVLLCAAGVVLALLRDDERPRGRLLVVLATVTLGALVCCVLASTMGVEATMVNPVPSGSP